MRWKNSRSERIYLLQKYFAASRPITAPNLLTYRHCLHLGAARYILLIRILPGNAARMNGIMGWSGDSFPKQRPFAMYPTPWYEKLKTGAICCHERSWDTKRRKNASSKSCHWSPSSKCCRFLVSVAFEIAFYDFVYYTIQHKKTISCCHKTKQSYSVLLYSSV